MNEMLLQNKFFTAVRVAEGVTRITGMARENCYLVEGTKRALLIDGLTGISSLKAFVRELTELPVTVALTHAHMDHSGIAWESKQICLHPEDLVLLYPEDVEKSRQDRLGFVELFHKFGVPLRTTPVLDDILLSRPVKVIPMLDGDRFDLGGLEIEVIHVPGHTRGSVVFLDRTHRCVYTGDACNSNTLLNLPASASVREYRDGLLHFKEFYEEFDVVYGGHDQEAQPKTIVNDGIALCERILTGTDDAIPIQDAFTHGGTALLAAERLEGGYQIKGGGLCNIVYRKETVETSERPEL